MTLRQEFEDLKTELSIRLTDATVTCSLDFPFDLKIPPEDEKFYFILGANTRLAMKKSMIILDNTYKKFRLFPSDENADAFVELRDEILIDCKNNVMNAYSSEHWRFKGETRESYEKFLDDLIEKIKEASLPYIDLLRTLTPKDIEREIKAKDNMKKIEEANRHANDDDPRDLF